MGRGAGRRGETKIPIFASLTVNTPPLPDSQPAAMLSLLLCTSSPGARSMCPLFLSLLFNLPPPPSAPARLATPSWPPRPLPNFSPVIFGRLIFLGLDSRPRVGRPVECANGGLVPFLGLVS